MPCVPPFSRCWAPAEGQGGTKILWWPAVFRLIVKCTVCASLEPLLLATFMAETFQRACLASNTLNSFLPPQDRSSQHP